MEAIRDDGPTTRRTQSLLVHRPACDTAAARLGTSTDAVAAAVAAYREALASLDEPVWAPVLHMGFAGGGASMWRAEGTDVTMTILARPDGAAGDRVYGFKGVPFETFAEANGFEDRWNLAIERRDDATLDALHTVVMTHET